jgi:phage terminase small subunit
MKREYGKLTPKKERFVQEYLVDLNGTQAAIRTGYSKKTAQEQASRLLSNVMVSKAIAEGQAKLAKTVGVTAEKVIAEMARIGFANMQDYLDLSDPENPTVDLSNLTPEQASVIAEATVEKKGFERRVKIKLHDKLNALVNLGKHLGLFSERHLLGGLDGGDIKHVQHMEVVFVDSKRAQ